MAKYEVAKGKHIHEGITYTEGDVIESDKPLDRIWQNKFVKVGTKDKKQLKLLKKKQRKNEDVDTDDEDTLGENVTDQFPAAARVDCLVFKKDGKFVVADADEPDTPIHDGTLDDKKELDKFLTSRSGEAEDSEKADEDESGDETEEAGEEAEAPAPKKKSKSGKKSGKKKKSKE